METTYNFLLDLALILLTTKILGLVTRRYNMPQVVGALLAGLLMGPACLNILHETTFIHDGCLWQTECGEFHADRLSCTKDPVQCPGNTKIKDTCQQTRKETG